MNQADLQRLAAERIEDAKVLLAGGRWEFAYYSAGYAVECALQTCVLARMVYTGWVFKEKWKASDCLTHEPGELVRLAGLEAELDGRIKTGAAANDQFLTNWTRVSDWKVTSRYEAKTQDEARDLFEAIISNGDGVLPWIKMYW